MSQFIAEDTRIIQADWWDEDEQVVIRRFTWGDRQELIQAAIDTDIVDGQPRINEMQLGRMNLRIMELGIKSWTLKGPEGKVVPPSRNWIYRLDEETGNFILREINAFNPRRGRSAEEQISFRGDDRDGSVERQRAAGRANANFGDGGDGLELAGTESDAARDSGGRHHPAEQT